MLKLAPGKLDLLEADGFRLIDCQIYTAHLISLGAEEISRETFCRHLKRWCPHDNGDQQTWEPLADRWPRP